MDEQSQQDLAAEESLVARVRAADPAADVTPTEALRVEVDARRAAEPDVEPDVVPGVVGDELAARRARRWTGWPAKIAGVAAAALVVGGGGYAIGAAGGGDGSGDTLADGGAAPAMTLQNSDAQEEGAAASAPNTPTGLGITSDARGSMTDSSYWGGRGRMVFTASGLSDAGTSLRAWAFDAAAVFNEQTIATAAAALGVAGTPQLVDGTWSVGPNDGTGPMVSMYADGTASLSYWDPSKDVWYCPASAGAADATREAETDPGSDVVVPEPESCEERDLGPAPQGDAAARMLRDVLSALGNDPAAYEVVAESYGDESPDYAYVTAYQVLDGQRTGVTWSATMTGAGTQSLYGSTAPLVDIGEYDVISPVEAVARLSDPRFGSGFYGPLFYRDGIAVDTGIAVDEPGMTTSTVPPTVGVGSLISWPVEQAAIVQARLGLAVNTQADGSAMLVPTYELTSDSGAVWSVIAVADTELDFSATS